MGDFSECARKTIDEVRLSLPDGFPFKARKAAIDKAYPFQQRTGSAYKAWLCARRDYLARHGGCDRQKLTRSPLWRAPRR